MLRILHLTSWDVVTQRPHHFVREDNLLGNISDVVCFSSFGSFFKKNPQDQWAHKIYRCNNLFPVKIITFFKLFNNIVEHYRSGFIKRIITEVAQNYDFIIINNPAFNIFLSDNLPPVIYDCMDDWAEFTSSAPQYSKIFNQELEIASLAKIIWTVSPPLHQKFSRLFPGKVHLIPNGCDFTYFEKNGVRKIHQLRGSGEPPVILYVGTLSKWMDLELIEKLAAKLINYNFKFYGPVNEFLTQVFHRIPVDYPNIKMMGAIPYSQVPGILTEADVCIIPFSTNKLTESVSPIKFYEYLSMGIPVVSSPMPDIIKYQEKGVAYACTTVDQWVEAIQEAYALRSEPELCERRIQIARENSWAARWAQCLKTLGAV